jgi:2-phospho-L-lactate guanylyltransferase
MPDLNIIVPFKDPAHAKERLSEVLSPGQRKELALLLFDELMRLLKGLSHAYHILVVTDSEEVDARAKSFSVSVLREQGAEGETEAVTLATAWSVANDFSSQLVVPADMARVDPADLAALLNHPRATPSVLLCPAVGDNGTNAILTTPPNVLAFRFGERSFPDYKQQAAARGIPCEVLRLPSLVLDLDTPDDLRSFMKQHTEKHPAVKLLRQWQIHHTL